MHLRCPHEYEFLLPMWMIEVVVGPGRIFSFAGTGFQSVCPPYVELVISPSAFRIMALLVGHSEATCPLPKHLKRFMFLVPVLDDEA